MTARRLWEAFNPAGTLGFAFAPDELAAVAAIEGATEPLSRRTRPARRTFIRSWKADGLYMAPWMLQWGCGLMTKKKMKKRKPGDGRQ